MSPPRNYDDTANWLYSPNDGTIRPVSREHSSIGHFSGSDWTTDSSWMSNDSLVQYVFNPPISSRFPPISLLPLIVDVPQESQGLSQSQQSCGITNTIETPREVSGENDR